MEILDQIKNINQAICENIEKNLILNDRGLISQNILSQLRNLLEHCSLYMHKQLQNQDSDISLEEAKEKLPSMPGEISKMSQESRFITKFHKLLQITESHYTHDKNNSERLMLKYYEYLFLLKKLCKNKFNLNILDNLYKFPLDLDKNLNEYYEKILIELDKFKLNANTENKNRYYVWKVKPVFVKEEIFYEITLTNATDNTSKFSRIVVFSRVSISDNYAIKARVNKAKILIQNKYMPIFILSDMEISIRDCEFKNFAKIFGSRQNQVSTTEIQRINAYLMRNDYNLLNIINLSNFDYDSFKQKIKSGNIQIKFLEILDKCKEICRNNKNASNIIKYLLYKMNNKVIKNQILKPKSGREYKPNDKLSNLYLKYEAIPFDQMPFISSLCGHNPKISDLLECIDYKNKEHEFLARFIIQNTENNGFLYAKQDELSDFNNLPILVQKFNNLLYDKHKDDRKICDWKGNYYINSYEKNVINILRKLKELSKQGLDDYEKFANNWLEDNSDKIDDEAKRQIIKSLFIKSKVAFVYGAAGTGKSTLADYISNLHKDKKQIFTAQTNPAVENIKSKVQNANFSNTYTVAKITKSKQNFECDLLFIDECSTVSNGDMVEILEKVKFKCLILIGDTYQIEAIKYGTWFDIAREFLPNHSRFELITPYRTNDDNLLKFWECVRNFKNDDNKIDEFGVWGRYFLNLDEKNDEIFYKQYDDEIVLCLNYDGLYGVNNINKFLQIVNKNPSFEIGDFEFKVADPVLFVDNNFFVSDLHNNLKGKITKIINKDEANELYFEIEVDKIFENNHNFTAGLKLISTSGGKTTVGFSVDKNINTDNDDAQEKLPFMLAYAISIHKSQGLEYESVKIVITKEMEENITHDIFYTAITRAKKHLKIYWSPETQRHIIKNFNIKNNKTDVKILKAKFCLM